MCPRRLLCTGICRRGGCKIQQLQFVGALFVKQFFNESSTSGDVGTLRQIIIVAFFCLLLALSMLLRVPTPSSISGSVEIKTN